MNNDNDKLVNYLKGDKIADNVGGDEPVWNLLVQILLPLVLILTYVVVTQIIGYKKAYENLYWATREMTDSENHITNDEERQLAIIDAQLQNLLLSLERIKINEKKGIKLDLFPEQKLIRRDGIHVNDDNFIDLCKKTNANFHNKQSYMDTLYKKVQKNANIKDNGNISVRKWNLEKEDLNEAEKFKRVTSAERNKVYYKNRKIIHNNIYDFIEGLETDIINLQKELIRELFEDMRENPEGLDEKSTEDLNKLLDPAIDNNIRQEIAEKMHRKCIQKLQKKLENDGYIFLETSWKDIQIINNR